MFEHSLVGERATVPSRASGEASATPDRRLLAKQFAGGLSNIAPAIALAGAAYPVLIALGYPVVLFAALITSNCNWSDFGDGLIVAMAGSFFGAGIGLIWATIVSFAILPLVYLFVRSLELRGSIVRLGAFYGGLVGFVAVMPLFLGALSDVGNSLTELGMVVLLGPALTTIIGQAGGAWGGWRTLWYERAVARAAIGGRRLPEKVPAKCLEKNCARPHSGLQFGIRHLLVISIWVSLLLTVIRLSGLDYLFLLFLFTVWGAYQMATLWVGGLLAGRFARWKGRRQSRST